MLNSICLRASFAQTFYSLSTSDVDVPSPDEKSVITYVSSIYDAFPKIPEGGEGIAAHVCSLHIALTLFKPYLLSLMYSM